MDNDRCDDAGRGGALLSARAHARRAPDPSPKHETLYREILKGFRPDCMSCGAVVSSVLLGLILLYLAVLLCLVVSPFVFLGLALPRLVLLYVAVGAGEGKVLERPRRRLPSRIGNSYEYQVETGSFYQNLFAKHYFFVFVSQYGA